MEWEPQCHLSSVGEFRSAAALRHDGTSQMKTTLAKTLVVSVRQAKSKTLNSKGREVRVRRSTCPVSNPGNLCASHILRDEAG